MIITIVVICSLLFIFGYAALILTYCRAWSSIPESKLETAAPSSNHEGVLMSVIIPARNEAASIKACVHSVLSQECDSEFEVIVVDDHSTDDTAAVVEAMNEQHVRVVRLAELSMKDEEVAYKKRAIEAGVACSAGNIIITTDADCSHHPNWLKSIEQAFRGDAVDMVSGPVLFEYDDSIFQKFQALDFVGMIGITAASLQLGMFNLANGANLAFRKSVFQSVDGYSGIDRKASGDDMLLIYKFAQRSPSRIRFLKSKEAAVYTRPAEDLAEFTQQRLRWTSKSFSYQDKRITLILAFVYLANLNYLFLAIGALFSSNQTFYLLLILQMAVMFTVDFLFLKKVTRYFDRRNLMGSFLPSQLLHIVYIISIGLLGNLLKYRWKGRKLN